MEWHIGEAIKSGASYDKIMETIGVAIEMGGGLIKCIIKICIKSFRKSSEKLLTKKVILQAVSNMFPL
jgi:hypothetical protein